MAKKIKNLHELGTDLLDVYTSLRNGQMEVKQAKAIAGVAGKVIDSLKVQINYNVKKPTIEKIQLLEHKNGRKALN